MSESLIECAKNNDVNHLEFLLQSGHDANTKDSSGGTALMYASENGFFKIVELLINNLANPNAKDDNGSTAFRFCF